MSECEGKAENICSHRVRPVCDIKPTVCRPRRLSTCRADRTISAARSPSTMLGYIREHGGHGDDAVKLYRRAQRRSVVAARCTRPAKRSNAPAEPVFGEVLNRGTPCGGATLSRFSARGGVACSRLAQAWAKVSHLLDCSAKEPERWTCLDQSAGSQRSSPPTWSATVG